MVVFASEASQNSIDSVFRRSIQEIRSTQIQSTVTKRTKDKMAALAPTKDSHLLHYTRQ